MERRSAWLAPEDAGRFTSLDDLLRDRLHYMTVGVARISYGPIPYISAMDALREDSLKALR
jgi:hypothetical protein